MSALLLLYYQIFHYLNVRLAIAKDFLYDFYSLNQFRLACYPFFIVESLRSNMVTFYDLIGFFLCICTPCTLQMMMIIMTNNNNDHNKMKNFIQSSVQLARCRY